MATKRGNTKIKRTKSPKQGVRLQKKKIVARTPVKKKAEKPLQKPPQKIGASLARSGGKSVPKPSLKVTVKKVMKKEKKSLAKKVSARKRIVRKPRVPVYQGPAKARGLERSAINPILKPTQHSWETQATFNPGAVQVNDKVHLIYRAIGTDDMSVFGYSSSKDGHTIDYRSTRPVYYAPAAFELREPGLPRYLSPSGGGYGGCEDPRLTAIDGKIYLTYTSWNGYEAPRVALTSISVDDFLRKNWNWGRSVLISPPGEMHKNWVIFPEKINGKFALLHSITPDILIDYFDDLDFDGKTFVKSRHTAPERKGVWDSRVRGVGPPPMKTKDGWLLIYHAIDDKDPGRYKIGAMLLDLKDPTKILYRSSAPILAPDEVYENEGYKSGIIYSCGAAIIEGTLLIYYGGADTVGCVASADLNTFLSDLKKTSQPRLKKKIIVREA
ncbi:MAG: hypothetical protein AAB691_01505 [Patescibacteria group bacterium]